MPKVRKRVHPRVLETGAMVVVTTVHKGEPVEREAVVLGKRRTCRHCDCLEVFNRQECPGRRYKYCQYWPYEVHVEFAPRLVGGTFTRTAYGERVWLEARTCEPKEA